MLEQGLKESVTRVERLWTCFFVGWEDPDCLVRKILLRMTEEIESAWNSPCGKFVEKANWGPRIMWLRDGAGILGPERRMREANMTLHDEPCLYK